MYLVEKSLEQRTGFEEASDAKYLKVGECSAVAPWQAVDRRAHGEHELELEDRPVDVGLEAE